MLDITSEAQQELQRIINARNIGDDQYLRLAMPPVWIGEGDWGIVISEKSEDDELIEFEGVTVLLMDPSVYEHMSEAVLDFKDSPEGFRFTLDLY